MTKPIKVRVTKQVRGWPEGAELGYSTVDLANQHLGVNTYEVVSYQDGTPYEAESDSPRPTSLKSMKRAELEAFGESVGFPDATSFAGTKDQLREAIEAFQGTEPANGPEGPESAQENGEGQ